MKLGNTIRAMLIPLLFIYLSIYLKYELMMRPLSFYLLLNTMQL